MPSIDMTTRFILSFASSAQNDLPPLYRRADPGSRVAPMKLPRFSLRELFLLVVIAAVGCGWWVERSRATAVQAERDKYRDRARWLLQVSSEAGSDWINDDGSRWKPGDDVMVGYGGNHATEFYRAKVEELLRENNGLRIRLGEPPIAAPGASVILLPKGIPVPSRN